MSDLETFRKDKDAFFVADAHSPLTATQKRAFKGLKYFPQNPALRLELPIEELTAKETVEMQTSTGDVQAYQRFGKIKFAVEGTEAELTIYSSEHGFFLPFVDALAGKETYGAGRYLDPELLPGAKIRVDFNLAYNPYCAYNDRWSCPLTPSENRLKAPIRAGEKAFHP
jgi:uncharacterized protein (DUF1684 family)